MRFTRVLACAAVGLTTALLGGLAPAGATAPTAPQTGPAYSVPTSTLDAALKCHGDLAASARAGRAPVLLIHGTTSSAEADFGWNWDLQLDRLNWARCDIELPNNGNGDIQLAAEYVVRAIRTMSTAAGHRIDMVGHSQGGMIGRWALKYWPDTRADVDDYVGLAASNHGTLDFIAECQGLGNCPAADWQQRTGSAFLTALNTGPQTWPGISYTEIYTRDDEIVTPNFDNTGSSSLPAAPNVTDVAVQDLCPSELVEHFGMSYDNAAYQLGMDALTHPGPAVLSRTSRATCGNPFMPAVTPLSFLLNVGPGLGQSISSTIAAPRLTAEPPLRCYAAGTCPA